MTEISIIDTRFITHSPPGVLTIFHLLDLDQEGGSDAFGKHRLTLGHSTHCRCVGHGWVTVIAVSWEPWGCLKIRVEALGLTITIHERMICDTKHMVHRSVEMDHEKV